MNESILRFRYLSLLKGMLFLLSLVGIGWLLYSLNSGPFMDQDWIDREVVGRGIQGGMLFLAMAAFFTAVGLPRQLVSFFSGYAFGFIDGSLLALVATVLGCLLSYFYAFWFGHRLLAPRLRRRSRRFHQLVLAHPFSLALLVHLSPAGSNLVANLLAGAAKAPLGWFLLGSTIGYVPQTLVFALAGSGIDIHSGTRIALAALLFLVSGLLGAYLYHCFRQRG
jgi:uncharacterized membrane protein YdjX (TVP38/TMEM64 family)